MIRFVEYNHIDTNKWDQCIIKSVNSVPYAFSWYLDIVVKQWDALILNDYQAVFPLPTRSKFGFQYSFTPFWVQQLGIFSKTKKDLELIDDFIDNIPKKYRFIELNMNHNCILKNFLYEYKIKNNDNYMLILDRSYEEQIHGYSKNLKRKVEYNVTP